MSPPGASDSQSLLETEVFLAISKKPRRGREITEEERISQIAECLEDGLYIDTRLGGKGQTVLHIAIEKGYEKVVKFLRQRGARIDIRNDKGLTAITLAERFDNPRIASILREPVRRELAEGNDDNEQPSTSKDGASPRFSHSSQARIIDNQGINPGAPPYSMKRKQSDVNYGYDKSAKQRRLDSKKAVYTDLGGDPHLGDDAEYNTRSSRYDDEETYAASGLKRSLHGTVYQLKHLMLIVHRVWKKKYSFRLSTEMDAAEKFDDLVLEYEDSTGKEVHRFVQLKHKADDNKTIKAGDLLDTKDGDFSVFKYFNSWRKIRNHPNFRGCESQKFILCTNIDLDENGLRSAGVVIEEIQEPDDFLKVTNRPEQPPRYKLLVEKSSELWNTLKSASDVHRLATALAERVHKDEQIALTASIFKDYHVALAKEVIDIGGKKFFGNFIKNKNLSPGAEEFREILFTNTKQLLRRITSEKDICEWLEKRVLKLSTTFGRKFEPVARPELSDVKEFSRKFVVLLDNSIDNVIEIDRQKHASASASDKKFSDDIDKLAGHVLIKEAGKIKFSQRFLDDNDDVQFTGNLKEFKAELKNQLAKEFDELVNFELKINSFKTCTEEELSVKTQLPNDDVNDKEISDFLGNFILAVKQPNEIELGEMIKSEMGAYSQFNILNADFIKDSFQSEILDWFKKTEESSTFLNHKKAEDFFKKTETKLSSLVAIGLNLPYPAELETYDIRYKEKINDLQNFLENSNRTKGRILQMISPTQTFLTALRVYQTLKLTEKYEKNDSFIFIHLDKLLLPMITSQVLSAFKSEFSHDLLVIDCEAISRMKQGRYIHRLWDQLREIVEGNSDKKMILIIQGDDDSAVEFEINYETCDEKDDDIGIDNLDEDSRRRLLQNMVIRFQGREEKTSFYRLLNIGDFDNEAAGISTSLRRIIAPNTLIQLIKNEEVQIGDKLEGPGHIGDYYISRTVVRRVIIERRILKDSNAPDLLAISDIGTGALRKLVAERMGRESFQDDGPPKRYFILNSGKEEEEFKILCDKYPDRNIHWLEGGTGELIWIKTSGGISNLVEFKDEGIARNQNVESSIGLTEEQLVADDEQRIVIISDVAGMGKSTVLTHLGSIMKQRKSNMLVIRINLTQHTKALEKLVEKQTSYQNNTEGAVDFLVDELLSLKTISESETFKAIIKGQGEAALLFDGFDEISPTYEDTVIGLIQALAKCPIKKLFVTTRPHTRKSLETELGIFSQLMLSFSEANQTEFLTKFWKEGMSPSDVADDKVAELLEQHAKAVIKILAESINQQMNEFMGVPLQTRLVAEVFPYRKDGKLPKSIDIIYMYEQFVDKKYDIFLSEKKPGDKTNLAERRIRKITRKIFFMRHQKLALDLLFHEVTVAELLKAQPEVGRGFDSFLDKSEGEERTGIVINEVSAGKPEFIHRTFAEYFAAVFLLETLEDDSRNQQVRGFFLSELFDSPQHKTIRLFLECLLSRERNAPENQPWKFDLRTNFFTPRTVFHVAAKEGNVEILRFCCKRLTRHGELKVSNIDGRQSQDTASLQRQADINVKNFSGLTALHTASTTNRYTTLDVVKCLIEWGADPNIPDRGGHVPLRFAAESGNLEVAQYLVEKGADLLSKSSNGLTILHYAAKSGSLKMVEYILRMAQGVDINTRDYINGRTPLFEAVSKNNLEMVKYLHDNGADLISKCKNGETALHSAVGDDRSEIVKYMLTMGPGIDVNIRDGTGKFPLLLALWNNNTDMVKYLHVKGAKLLTRGKNDNTLLHEAALVGNVEIIDYILKMEKGIHINIENQDGETPLHFASSSSGNLDVVKYLHEHSADIKFCCKNCMNSLHYAVEAAHNLKTIEYLIKIGVNINCQNKFGNTPLHVATKIGHWDVIKLLIENRADITLRNNSNQTPRDIAISKYGDSDRVRDLFAN